MVVKLLKGVPAWLVAALAVVLMTGAARASADTQPIEGTWNFGGGQVNVTATGPNTYQGVVTENTKFVNNECVHTAGSVVWQIQGSGDAYTGTHEWLRPINCGPAGQGQAAWTITSTSPTQNTMTFCTAAPGDGPPGTTNTPTNRCYQLTQAVTPAQEPAVPADSGAPAISGNPAVGQTLTCSTGSWSNSPTGYSYLWKRDGSPIAFAIQSTYQVASADAGHNLTCQVTAYNAGGAGQPATSAAVTVGAATSGGGGTPGSRGTAGCPTASGRLLGTRLGNIRLGMTRVAAQKAYAKNHDRKTKFRDLFCQTPHGLQVGYETAAVRRALLNSASSKAAGKRAGQRLLRHVIWVTTSNPAYALRGVHPGATLAAARHHVRLGTAQHAHGHTWYLVSSGSATGLIKVSRGKVTEIGIADRSLTRVAAVRTALLNGLA
jgi:hypothetical protein